MQTEDCSPRVETVVVFFTVSDEELKVLLLRRERPPEGGRWALPAGPLGRDEDLAGCAHRVLAQQTGAAGVYLEQLYTFGAPAGDPRGPTVSVAYYALAPGEAIRLRPAEGASAVRWFAINDLPGLAFDHGEIVRAAHRRLAAKLDYSTIAFQFMAEKFTLSELQAVYETILNEALDKRNFRKWVLALECIEETGEEWRAGSHRPARLYRVKGRDVEIIK